MKVFKLFACLLLSLNLGLCGCQADHFGCEPESLVLSADAQDGIILVKEGFIQDIFPDGHIIYMASGGKESMGEDYIYERLNGVIILESSWYKIYHRTYSDAITVSVKENTSPSPRTELLNITYTASRRARAKTFYVTIIQQGCE